MAAMTSGVRLAIGILRDENMFMKSLLLNSDTVTHLYKLFLETFIINYI